MDNPQSEVEKSSLTKSFRAYLKPQDDDEVIVNHVYLRLLQFKRRDLPLWHRVVLDDEELYAIFLFPFPVVAYLALHLIGASSVITDILLLLMFLLPILLMPLLFLNVNNRYIRGYWRCFPENAESVRMRILDHITGVMGPASVSEKVVVSGKEVVRHIDLDGIFHITIYPSVETDAVSYVHMGPIRRSTRKHYLHMLEL